MVVMGGKNCIRSIFTEKITMPTSLANSGEISILHKLTNVHGRDLEKIT